MIANRALIICELSGDYIDKQSVIKKAEVSLFDSNVNCETTRLVFLVCQNLDTSKKCN